MPDDDENSASTLAEAFMAALVFGVAGGGVVAHHVIKYKAFLLEPVFLIALLVQSVVAGVILNWTLMAFAHFYVARILKLPLSKDYATRLQEIHAYLFPRSVTAVKVQKRTACAVDHLVYTTARLEAGIAAIERLTGVRAVPCGSPSGRGTKSAVLHLGGHAYLEIVAPDPAQPPASRAARPWPRRPERHDRLVAFAVRPAPGVEGACAAVLAAALQSARALPRWRGSAVVTRTRRKGDGSELEWEETPLAHAAGPTPFVVDWKDAAASPARTAPKGCRLVGLSCYGADAAERCTLLKRAMRLQPLETAKGPAAADAATPPVLPEVAFVQRDGATGGGGFLIADVETPNKGRVRLGERALQRVRGADEGPGPDAAKRA